MTIERDYRRPDSHWVGEPSNQAPRQADQHRAGQDHRERAAGAPYAASEDRDPRRGGERRAQGLSRSHIRRSRGNHDGIRLLMTSTTSARPQSSSKACPAPNPLPPRALFDHLISAQQDRWGYGKAERRLPCRHVATMGEQRLHFFLINSAASIVWARSRSISSACRRINSAA